MFKDWGLPLGPSKEWFQFPGGLKMRFKRTTRHSRDPIHSHLTRTLTSPVSTLGPAFHRWQDDEDFDGHAAHQHQDLGRRENPDRCVS